MNPTQQVLDPVTEADTPTNVYRLPATDALVALHTAARDRTASQADFIRAAARLIHIVLEESLARMRHTQATVTTPTGFQFTGLKRTQDDIFAVSVPRAGDAFEAELRQLCPGARLGKILIQRDPTTKLPHLFYTKLPRDIAGREVLLMDPMLATAGTTLLAIDTLEAAGVREQDIIFANVLACPSGLEALTKARPATRVVTSFVDEGLTEQAFMRPGIGDFGDRYFGTTS
jgi:uracil phosphoribosyltransferase